MKTVDEILEYIEDDMVSIVTRPQMWFDTAVGFEKEYVARLRLRLFIRNRLDINPMDEWRKFAHDETGYNIPAPVASYLKKNNKLDEDWENLADLLKRFGDKINGR